MSVPWWIVMRLPVPRVGVDTSQLTQATVGEQLQDRQLTEVVLSEEQQQAVAASRVRTQEELRTVIEDSRIHFDRQFRMALRRNPALAGSVTLKAEIQPDGKVSSCSGQQQRTER